MQKMTLYIIAILIFPFDCFFFHFTNTSITDFNYVMNLRLNKIKVKYLIKYCSFLLPQLILTAEHFIWDDSGIVLHAFQLALVKIDYPSWSEPTIIEDDYEKKAKVKSAVFRVASIIM